MSNFLDWLEQSWATILIVISGVTLVWNFFHKTLREINTEVTKPLKDINTRLDQVETKLSKDSEVMGTAMQTILKKSLLDSCERYLNRGYATLHQKEVVMMQFESYKALGGNSFIHNLVEQVNNLPLEESTKTILNE